MRSSLTSLTCSLACLAGSSLLANAADANASWPWQTYKSSTAEPPSLKITKTGPTSPGYLFFDGMGPYAHSYNLFIMSDDNELIWQGPFGDQSAYKPQMLDGKPVLTYFNGISFSEPYGWGHGIIQILDNSYESIYNVSLTTADGGFQTIDGIDTSGFVSYIDMHEARITDENTLLVTLYNVTQHDLSSVGGPEDGWVADSLFYEIDIKTNEILFKWSALDHVDQIPISDVLEFYPIEEYGRNKTLPYGYMHINSVEKFSDGSYLISSRFFCSIFRIARDGTVQWTLQGKDGGDFELGKGLSFCYQHDARVHKETGSKYEISIFDNANSGIVYGEQQTAGIYMEVDEEKMTATLLQEYMDPNDPVYAASQGNTQVLDDGHVIMGCGSTSKIKEYEADGTPVMTAQFGPGDGNIFSYRAYRQQWVGLPKTDPSAFACFNKSQNQTLVYMSWNGATEHKLWNVYAGEDEQHLFVAAEAKRSGFETLAKVPGQPAYVRAEAKGLGVSGVSSVVEVASNCS